jgi:hypothetical protein
MTCPCGSPSAPNDHLCARCRYFQNVFRPPTPEFESKRDRALKAIYNRRLMKADRKVLVIE